jgi:hypothetical protein
MGGCGHSSSSPPSTHADVGPVVRSTDPPGVVALVADARSHLAGLAFDGRGDLLAIWARGWSAHPTEAFAVRTRSGRVTLGRAPAGTFLAGVLPRGWVVSSGGHRYALVGRQATERPVTAFATTTRSRPGDVRLSHAGRLLLYRPAAHRILRPPAGSSAPHPSGGYVTSDGTLVTIGSRPHAAAWRAWRQGRARSGVWRQAQSADLVAGHGARVAVVLGHYLGNGVDATGVAGLASTADGGRTWQVRGAPAGLVEALGLVVLRDGMAFVATSSGPLLRARPGEPLRVVPGIRPFRLARWRDRLYAVTSPGRRYTEPRLQVSDDDARTWTRVPLPGRGH